MAQPSADELRETRLRHYAVEIGGWLDDMSDAEVRVLAHRLVWLVRSTHRAVFDGEVDDRDTVSVFFWQMTRALIAVDAEMILGQRTPDEAGMLRSVLDDLRALIPDC